jgi:hypothetical protein
MCRPKDTIRRTQTLQFSAQRMFLGIKLEGWLTISAIILGPVLAFLIQDWRDRRRERTNRRRQIFQQLLLTLKVPMAPRHVVAINSVLLEFYSNAAIFQAWREYTSHLNNKDLLKNFPQRWGERKYELLINLAYEMGKSLDYNHIDKSTLRDNVYVSQGYDDQEEQFRQMRAAMLQVLQGERPVPVTMVGPVQVEEPLQTLKELPVSHRPALPFPPPDRH